MCDNCAALEKKVSVLQADMEFEIKKQKEDHASAKVTLEISLQKEIKKLQEKQSRDRGERDYENRKWISKHDQTVVDYERKLAWLKLQCEERIAEEYRMLRSKYDAANSDADELCKRKLEETVAYHQREVNALKAQLGAEIAAVRSMSDRKLDQQAQSYKEQISMLIMTQYQQLKAERYQNQAQRREQYAALNEANKKNLRLYEEIFDRKEEIAYLKAEVSRLQKEVYEWKEIVNMREKYIESLKYEHMESQLQLKRVLVSYKYAVEKELKTKVAELLRSYLTSCEKYENIVQEIEVKRSNEIEIFKNNLNYVKVYVESRPSRNEDMEEIFHLRELLSAKERYYEAALREAKEYRLELDNKEETFNRIFVSANNANMRCDVGYRRQSSKFKRNSKCFPSTHEMHLPSACNMLSVTTVPSQVELPRKSIKTNKLL